MTKEATNVEDLSAKLESNITLEPKKDAEFPTPTTPDSKPPVSDEVEPNAGTVLTPFFILLQGVLKLFFYTQKKPPLPTPLSLRSFSVRGS